MKILFLTNNDITAPLIDWLRDEAKETVIQTSQKISLKDIEKIRPNLVLSYNYKYKIEESIIGVMGRGRILNLHISLLPWNRGAHPNLWSFIENTPKGVTIHLIDKDIDTGDILLQKEIELDEHKERLDSSYRKLHSEIQELFKVNWNKIKNLELSPRPQPPGGSLHRDKDFEGIKHIFGKDGWQIPVHKIKRLIEKHFRDGAFHGD